MAGSRKDRESAAEVPEGFVLASVQSVEPTPMGTAVLLSGGSAASVVPIFIGETEALSIWLRIERRRYERPLTHDLLEQMLRELGGRITEVRIDDLRSNTFVATISVEQGKRKFTFDARASDGIALALGSGAPLYLSQAVLDEAGVPWEPSETPEPKPESESL